jgi:hypothetical protein
MARKSQGGRLRQEESGARRAPEGAKMFQLPAPPGARFLAQIPLLHEREVEAYHKRLGDDEAGRLVREMGRGESVIKRPLNVRFRDNVMAEVKTTTIRNNPWPVGKPIMLYSWSGKAYRSKQDDLTPVMVKSATPIRITRAGDKIIYQTLMRLPRPLWACEGFHSQSDMDDWFRATLKTGQSHSKHIMLFRLERRES